MRARVKTAEEITGVKGIKSFDLAGGIIYSYAFNRLREIEVEELGKDNIYNFHDEIGHCFLKEWLEFLPEQDLEDEAVLTPFGEAMDAIRKIKDITEEILRRY